MMRSWSEPSDEEKRQAREQEELEKPLLKGRWVTAAEALEMASRRDGNENAAAFLTRAAALELDQRPMLRTKAAKAEVSPPASYLPVRRDRIVHRFWWDGKVEVEHWGAGFFELRSRHYQDRAMRLSGLHFSLDDLTALGMEAVEKNVMAKSGNASATNEKRGRGGRRPSNWWPHFAAELAVYVHENGIPLGTGSDGQGDVIAAIQKRMVENGHEGVPDRSSIQPVVQAVLDRLRNSAG